jgi:hypothetical protein
MKVVPAYIVVFTCFTSMVQAQQNFLVYRVTGSVTYNTPRTQGRLKIGKLIPETATVDVMNESRVMLICEGASSPIILEKGTYRMVTYKSRCTTMDRSITANYLNYVWWQLTNPKSSAEDERKKNMTGPGAVSRGCPGIDFYVPDTINYYQAGLPLRWKVYTPARKEFSVYQYADSPVPLYSFTPARDELPLDSLKKIFEPGTAYYWNIRLDGNEICPRKLIQVWDAGDYRELLENTTEKIFEGVDEAEKNYIIGYQMEKNLFPGEAYQYYKKAYELNKKDKRYKRTVVRFRKQFGEKK